MGSQPSKGRKRDSSIKTMKKCTQQKRRTLFEREISGSYIQSDEILQNRNNEIRTNFFGKMNKIVFVAFSLFVVFASHQVEGELP